VSRNGQTGLADKADAVVVPAIHEAEDGTRSLVITDEFRVPLNRPGQEPAVREYGFVAGLIEKGQTLQQAAAAELKQETGLEVTRFVNLPSPYTISSAGMSNECSQFAFCYCKGTPSRENLEPGEDINTTLVPLSDLLLWLSRPIPWSGRAAGIMFGLAFSGRMSWDLRENLIGVQIKGNRALVLGPDGGEIALLQAPSGIPFEAQVLDPMRAKLIEQPKAVAEELPVIDSSDIVLMTGKGTDEPVK
jgi:ADP-ribose pyrophosphatase YjhB (NUDIX family)